MLSKLITANNRDEMEAPAMKKKATSLSNDKELEITPADRDVGTEYAVDIPSLRRRRGGRERGNWCGRRRTRLQPFLAARVFRRQNGAACS